MIVKSRAPGRLIGMFGVVILSLFGCKSSIDPVEAWGDLYVKVLVQNHPTGGMAVSLVHETGVERQGEIRESGDLLLPALKPGTWTIGLEVPEGLMLAEGSNPATAEIQPFALTVVEFQLNPVRSTNH